MICRNKSNALIVPPDFNGETVDIAPSFDQDGIIILAFNDVRRSIYPAILVKPIETIRDHEQVLIRCSLGSCEGRGPFA
jgi:hypothetical protein